MQNAARIAWMFRLDPVMVLSERSDFAAVLRIASANIVAADRRRAQEQAKEGR